jgi:hypothetical protein
MKETESDSCPICSSALKQALSPTFDGVNVSCNRCGKFHLTGPMRACIPAKVGQNTGRIALVSNAIRRLGKTTEWPMVSTIRVDEFLKTSLPSVREQINNMVIYLAEDTDGPGELTDLETESHQSIAGSKTEAGFVLVLQYLEDSGLVTGIMIDTHDGLGSSKFALSVGGWEYYEKLQQDGISTRRAFMAMKFGDSDLNLMLEEAFRPGAKSAGFDLLKLDDEPKAGLIDDRLRVEIRTARFIIADLTHDNLGAYWEAGFAEGLGKPVIYTCEKTKFEEDKTHFDTNHHLTLVWDLNNKAEAMEKLKSIIRATFPSEAQLEDE